MSSKVPEASWDLYDTIQAVFQAPAYHLVFEILLILWIFRLLLFTKSYKPERTNLTEAEKDALLAEWQPEPLVPDTPEGDLALSNVKNRVVCSKIGRNVTLGNKECLNLAALNFLGMTGRKDIEEHAVTTIEKYGVGSCGPRGFYGTFDVHLALEDAVAKFMQCEEAILYSYGFATIASAIPAYAKRGDVIFCDEGVGFSLQQGVLASRSRVEYFMHNDMEHLEHLLKKQEEIDKKNPKKAKATRRFLLVEGLYINYGDVCPLPRLVELKEKYKLRLIMDESLSFGTLGRTGRGVTEHFGISIDEVTLISLSLENALSSIGGLCIGKAYVIDHQRLSGQGYCFSASLPPMLATSAQFALRVLEKNPELLTTLEENCRNMHAQLSKLRGLRVQGASFSPVKHLYLCEQSRDPDADRRQLQTIVDQAEKAGFALTLASYLEEESCPPPPSVRISVTSQLTDLDIRRSVAALSAICDAVL